MAYTSRAWVGGWQYDKAGTDFNAQTGRLLSGGADLQAASAAAALAATQLSVSESRRQLQLTDFQGHSYLQKSSHPMYVGPHPGYAWVDEYGQPLVLGPPALATTAVNIRAANPDNTANSSSSCCSLYTTMPAMARSMAIWKRISPGMLPGTSATPKSTTGEAHTYDPSLLEPVDFTHHLRKTDFAEYTEATLRGMQHIKAAAKK